MDEILWGLGGVGAQGRQFYMPDQILSLCCFLTE